MTKHLRTLQWNIGGGKIGTGPDGPYDTDGLDVLIAHIQQLSPDIITLQETHSRDEHNQAETIARALGWSDCINHAYAPSHIEAGQELGHAILSRFPLTQPGFELLPNPGLSLTMPNGQQALMHDKGISRCQIELPGSSRIEVVTLHLFPFRKAAADPLGPDFAALRSTITACVRPTSPLWLLQGDFNISHPSLRAFLPELFELTSMNEFVLPGPTTPRQRYYDHVLFRGLTLTTGQIDARITTDHYALVCDFTLP